MRRLAVDVAGPMWEALLVIITDVRSFLVRGTLPEEVTFEDRSAHPLDVYPEFDTPFHSVGRSFSGIYTEIVAEGGVSGVFGPIERPQALLIQDRLRPLLVGRDALAVEALHDRMLRLDRHGRSGAFVTAISALDCALWDLKGKAWGQPVHRLLGGPTRRAVPAYASMLGFSVDPERAAATAARFKEAGYTAQKWFFRFGPGQGTEGMARNLAMAEAVREAVGPGYRLMFDAFMSWDVPYAVSMLRGLEKVDPLWMEEPVPPERVGSFRRMKEAHRVPLATGEHVFTRWQVKELLVAGAIDWVQTDPDWAGGITEQVKICSLASAFDTPVIAHGHSLLPALHVAASQPQATVPMVEYLIRHQPYRQFFHRPFLEPVGGVLEVPEAPGLGFDLDEEKIEARESVEF